MEVIKVESVSLTINKTKLLDNISINVGEGEICGLIGRNGSGKTVLMKCICGFMTPQEGTITVHDKVIGKDVDFIPNAGIIIETPGFDSHHSGFKNLKNLAMINNKIDSKAIKEVIEKVGLNPDDKKKVGKYSLGMRQRLGLAQAIMENPDILILDEPMNGLDKHGVSEMRQYLLNLKKEGKTIILSSHSAEDIEVLCDKTYELDHGKIIG